MLKGLADEHVLRVFAQVVVATGTGLPERSDGAISIRYITAHGLSRETGLPVDDVLRALRRLTDARLTIEKGDGGGWRTDRHALRRATEARPQPDRPRPKSRAILVAESHGSRRSVGTPGMSHVDLGE
jgi:hypothetical protein